MRILPALFLFINRARVSAMAHWIRTTAGALIVIAILWYFFGRSDPAYQFITVDRGSIAETVSVTGNTTPISSASLGFGTGGVIAGVYVKVGDHVSAGGLLASLNTNDLAAQLAGAEAAVDTERAALHKLQDGATSENVAVSQAKLAVAEQSLANYYADVSATLADAYMKADDAVRNQSASFFTNGETSSPQLAITINDLILQSRITQRRVSASNELNAWKNGSITTDPADLDSALSAALKRLFIIRELMNDVVTASTEAVGLSSTLESAYRTDANDGLSEVNTAISSVNSAAQAIASAKASAAQSRAELNAIVAPASTSDIEAQEARVAQALASSASARARVQNAQIFAPFSGVVTQVDAKVGQIASLGTPLISLISSNAFEIEANVPETDVGRVAIGNPVEISFDAFPGEVFKGNVFFIDPAETVTQGVVEYKMKVAFGTSDPRMKSGLTANLDVETSRKDGTLVLPQYAIVENDIGTFVRVLIGGTATDTPITLGIRDQYGNAEILSGVKEGEQVLNIGLKQSP